MDCRDITRRIMYVAICAPLLVCAAKPAAAQRSQVIRHNVGFDTRLYVGRGPTVLYLHGNGKRRRRGSMVSVLPGRHR